MFFRLAGPSRTHTMVPGSPLSFRFPTVAPRAGVRMPCCADRTEGQRWGRLSIAPEAEHVSVTSSGSSAGEKAHILPTCVAAGRRVQGGRAGGLMSPAGTGLGRCCW